MSELIALPSLGESVREATIIHWLRQPGDTVAIGDPLVEVSTEKVDTEIRSPAAGVIEAILIAEGETVDFGTPLARIGQEPDYAVPAPEENPEVAEQINALEPSAHSTPDHDAHAGYATPLVRKLAFQLGIDLSSVAGTGGGGRISRADVASAVALRLPKCQPRSRDILRTWVDSSDERRDG